MLPARPICDCSKAPIYHRRRTDCLFSSLANVGRWILLISDNNQNTSLIALRHGFYPNGRAFLGKSAVSAWIVLDENLLRFVGRQKFVNLVYLPPLLVLNKA